MSEISGIIHETDEALARAKVRESSLHAEVELDLLPSVHFSVIPSRGQHPAGLRSLQTS